MCSFSLEPLDLRIDSKKIQSDATSLHNYYTDFPCYGSNYNESASFSSILHNDTNAGAPSYTLRHSTEVPPHGYSRNGSPISTDEGYFEEIPDYTLPNFQKFADSDRDSHLSRSVSSSPKEKKNTYRDLVPSMEKERRKPGRKPGQVSNVLHLWEFMRDLLHSANCDGIIEWISRRDGVFRVINSSEVARLWGEKKKNKKKMTYEKLSRSLRYSRIEGYFADLPKDKNYPKKLCFKFGPKSKDWL